MKEGNRKAIAQFLGGVSCQCSVTSTVQSLWPDHLPPRRLSPPRALFGQGPYLPLRSPPPSLHQDLRKRQHRKPKSLEQTSFRGPPPNPLLLTVQKSDQKPGLCWGGFLRGQRRPLGRCRREVAICARPRYGKSPTKARGLPRPRTPGPVSGAADLRLLL